MNWKLLSTLMTLVCVVTSVALGQGTSTTILQGNYITNVFGNSNFVLNPNAQTNTANVTVSNATVSRSTTTPLVATSEFTITTSTATGYADWSLRAFDQGMKGQNCEARFTYRGFSVGSTTAQILQGSNVVAQLTLTASTDPRIASINFPCGDLSAVTKFRLQQASASLTGTNEISGIYTGLATNMANVAQAEVVVSAKSNTAQIITNGGSDTLILGNEIFDTYGEYNSSTGEFTAKKSGTYVFSARIVPQTADADSNWYLSFRKNGVAYGMASVTVPYSAGGNTSIIYPGVSPVTQGIPLVPGDVVIMKVELAANTGNTQLLNGYSDMTVTRFPSSSELVVTPERQNVFGGVVYTAENQNLFGTTAEPTAYSSFNNSTWNKPAKLIGKAQVTTTNSGNDLGFSIPNMPVGNYKVTISGIIRASNGGTSDVNVKTECNFRIVETDSSGTVRTEVARQSTQDWSLTSALSEETSDYPTAFFGVYNNTSVTTRNFRLEAQKIADGSTSNVGFCQAYSGTGTNTYNTNIAFLLEPLDQPSNSALYVQGPVKAAETGAAIPSGYVGQVIHSIQTTGQTMATNNWAEITGLSVTLTPGIWMVQGTGYWNRNGAAMTAFEAACGLGSSSGDVSANYAATKFYRIRTAQEVALPSQVSANSLSIRSFYVRSDGTNLYFADGTTFISGSQTIKMACYTGQWTGGPVQASGVIEAVRIN